MYHKRDAKHKLLGPSASLILLLIAIAACAPTQPPVPAPAPQPAVPTIGAVPQLPAPTATAVPQIATPTSAPKPMQPMDKVTVRLSWTWKMEFAPLVIAQDKGYFKEQNIDIDLQEGKSSNDAILLVGNKSNDFGYASLTTMATAVGKGVPVIGIAGILNESPLAWASFSDQNIKKPKDLEGHSLAMSPGAAGSIIWPSFVKKWGIDTNKVKVVSLDAATKDRVWLEGGVDAEETFINNPAPLYQTTKKAEFMLLGDWGFNTLADGIVAHVDTIRARPDLTRRFLAATFKGYAYAQAHPDEALDALLARSELLRGQPRGFMLENLKKSLSLLHSPNAPNQPLGYMDQGDWKNTLDVLVQSGAVPAGMPDTSFYTNDFVPK